MDQDPPVRKLGRPPPSLTNLAGERRLSRWDEARRVAALRDYDILDTPPEESFDRITRLAQKIFRTSMVAVSLLDGRRQWFKSRLGVVAPETSEDGTFCRVVVDRSGPLVVEDVRDQPSMSASPHVVGSPFIRFYAGAPLITSKGDALGTLCVMDQEPRRFDADDLSILVDLAQLVMDEMDLRQLANIDSLTGALSRRAFREEAGRALALADREARPMSLVVFDIDRFKQVNDTRGHLVGDAVLKICLTACMTRLRRSDAIGRLGGEEFAVLLPNADEAAAFEVAEMLRTAIAAQSFDDDGGSFSITASFGVSTLSGPPDLDALLRAADAALYDAKAAGRNRCVAARCVVG